MTTKQRLSTLAVGSLLCAGLGTALVAAPAVAAPRDSDRDGLPNRWELANGTNPRKADAGTDKDRDALTALREYRIGTAGDDDDSDDDGFEDGAELRADDDLDPLDDDSDDDDVLDGDEDDDADEVDNEDEDDFSETCRFDDDDSDDDGLDDEDENEVGARADDDDSDDDGVRDGDDDGDDDDVADEDEDDDLPGASDDDCDDDRDDDGESDEDEGDRFGTIESFSTETGLLQVRRFDGLLVQGFVTDDTEIEIEDAGDDDSAYDDEDDDSSDDDGSEDSSDDSDDRAMRGDDEDAGDVTDLVVGALVAEIEFDDDVEPAPGAPDVIEEIEVYRATPTTP